MKFTIDPKRTNSLPELQHIQASTEDAIIPVYESESLRSQITNFNKKIPEIGYFVLHDVYVLGNGFLIDKDGYFINEVESRSDRLDLPLFIGNGVENKVKDGLKLLLDFGANNVRVNALSWVGNRRWDILFDEHRVIKLPSARPLESLERLKRLDLEFGVLSLDIPIIDLRSEEFFILLPNWENLDKNSSNTKLLGEGV